jgi:hypothetical protein
MWRLVPWVGGRNADEQVKDVASLNSLLHGAISATYKLGAEIQISPKI